MSMRTLIELNHDLSGDLASEEFLIFLGRYLRSGHPDEAEKLERFGARVVAMRHHSDKFWIEEGTDGFPPNYFDKDKDR